MGAGGPLRLVCWGRRVGCWFYSCPDRGTGTWDPEWKAAHSPEGAGSVQTSGRAVMAESGRGGGQQQQQALREPAPHSGTTHCFPVTSLGPVSCAFTLWPHMVPWRGGCRSRRQPVWRPGTREGRQRRGGCRRQAEGVGAGPRSWR